MEQNNFNWPLINDNVTSSDRKDYMHNYHKTHYSPKPRIINPEVKYGRPVKQHKLTEDMSAYQKHIENNAS